MEDEGCQGCRAEVFANHKTVVLQMSGDTPVVTSLDPWLRTGSNEILVFIRGPIGAGKMTVTVANGRIRHEVVVFGDDVRRYTRDAGPTPRPLSFRIGVPR